MSPFLIPNKSALVCNLNADLVIPPLICNYLSRRQESQNGQNDLEGPKFNVPHFQHQLRASRNACLVQIWWFRLKYVTSYRVDKSFKDKQTDRETDWQTDGRNDNTSLAWKAMR